MHLYMFDIFEKKQVWLPLLNFDPYTPYILISHTESFLSRSTQEIGNPKKR